MEVKKIGFIGLGMMGRPMAKHLIKPEFQLTFYARRREIIDEFEKLGAQFAGSPKEVAAASDYIISMVTDAAQTEEILFGKEGELEGIKEGSTIILTSTLDPFYCKEVAARVKGRGIHVLDAPVSGGPTGCEAASLTIMVGGEEDVFKDCLPILRSMGKNPFYQGSIGTGQMTKLCSNMVFLVGMETITEALRLAEKAGITQERFIQVIKTTTASCWAAHNWKGIASMKKDYREGRGAVQIDHAYISLNLMLDLANKFGARIPLPALCSQLDYSLGPEVL